MATLLEQAKQGKTPEQIKLVAEKENKNPETVRSALTQGLVVIPANKQRSKRDFNAFGKGLTTKVSASIGTSKGSTDFKAELEKSKIAEEAGAHALMDLSLGGDLRHNRIQLLNNTKLPVGTLPNYETFVTASETKGILNLTSDEFLKSIEDQAKDGVDFMGLHSAMTLKALQIAQSQGRTTDLVSWGGSLLAGWMLHHGQENPLFTRFDEILEIARTYDVTLSLADGLRPGSIADSLDRSQIQELVLLGELVDRARRADVQIMIKGPGHAPFHHIRATVQLMKQVCHGAPYFVFGPIVTDIAPGFDHITAAIGGASAGAAGADLLCYVTPAEHVRFPSKEDVYQGVIASRIAAHIADLNKDFEKASKWDRAMSENRNPWNLLKQRALALAPQELPQESEASMEGFPQCERCGEACSMKVVTNYFGKPHACC